MGWFDDAKAIQGWMSEDELKWLNRTAKALGRGAWICEVGSWKGRSSVALAAAAAETGSHLQCVDTWLGSKEERDNYHAEALEIDLLKVWRENLAPYRKYVEPWLGESEDVAAECLDGSYDMVFLDAGHSYDEVVADIRAWRPKVRRGGILCGHDATWQSVATALDDTLGSWAVAVNREDHMITFTTIWVAVV